MTLLKSGKFSFEGFTESMKTLIRYVCVISALMSGYAVAAEQLYPVVTYVCSPDEDAIKIKNEVKWGNEGKAIKYSDEEGIYNPWDWVGRDEAGNYTEEKMIELSCQLNKNIYKILIKPKLFSTHPSDKCGDRVSATISVIRGGSILLDRKDFESFCHGNAPIIRGIKVEGKTGEVKLYPVPKYKFY